MRSYESQKEHNFLENTVNNYKQELNQKLVFFLNYTDKSFLLEGSLVALYFCCYV